MFTELTREKGDVSISVTENNKDVICHGAASPPSGAHGGGWEGLGKDGGEAAL